MNKTSEQSDSGGDSPSRCCLTQSPPEGLKITASHRKVDFFTGRLSMAFVKTSHPVNEMKERMKLKNNTSEQSDSGGDLPSRCGLTQSPPEGLIITASHLL